MSKLEIFSVLTGCTFRVFRKVYKQFLNVVYFGETGC